MWFYRPRIGVYDYFCGMMSTSSILQRVQRFIEQERLLTPSARIIVGVSGGADSVALLHLLVQLGYDCIACHCNFNLRGDESLRDRDFTCRLASEWGVPYEEISFDTLSVASEEGMSIEMACRKLRYDWFEKMRLHHNAEAIAVAHHRDDSVETVLLNLIRGTGIAGLTSMRPRNERVVRPLLSLSRQEIEDYLATQGLTFVTDHTNLEAIYTRNKIRLEVLPLLRSINPSVDHAIHNTMLHLREVETLYREAITTQLQNLLRQRGECIYLSIEQLYQLSAPQAFLFEWLSPYGFEPNRIDEIMKCCEQGTPGKQFLSTTHRLVRDREELILEVQKDKSNDVVIIDKAQPHGVLWDGQLTYRCVSATNYTLPKGKEYACFDLDKITFPLTIRHWQTGDRFTPFGMRGSRKVSDYFNDRKYSLIDKANAWLLCSGETVLAILGERTAEGYRITPQTQQVIEFKYKK